MPKTFTIEISVCESFTIDEIWPDGDAPPDPTADDVMAVFLKNPYDVHRTCKDWGLEVRKENVQVTMHDPEALQRQLDQARERAKA